MTPPGEGPQLLVGWYGDDVTGSTDVLEALGSAGVPAVLFLGVPSAERLAAFPGRRAVGVAGIARSLPTAEIAAEVGPILAGLAALRPAIVHYKVCSTFDSAPDVGSIGAAIDAAWPILAPDWVPVLVAAPALGRYTAFATHFATFDAAVYRLDRHPVMSRHPVTPMHEADLRRHLAAQTDRPIGLVDLRSLGADAGAGDRALARELEGGRSTVVLDAVDDRSLGAAARLVWDHVPNDRPGFAVGSSGLEHGLVGVWRERALVDSAAIDRPAGARATGPVVAVSGSASAWTARQLDRAVASGWADVAFDTERELRRPDDARADAVREAVEGVRAGRSVVVHAALGPDDPRIERTRAIAADAGMTDGDLGRGLGEALGSVLADVLAATGARRALIAGGDASGWAARALGVEALDYLASLDLGVPICRATGAGVVDGLVVVMKSGQLGSEDVLVRLAE